MPFEGHNLNKMRQFSRGIERPIYYDEISTVDGQQWVFWMRCPSQQVSTDRLSYVNDERYGERVLKGVVCYLTHTYLLFFVYKPKDAKHYRGFFSDDSAKEALTLFKKYGFSCIKAAFPGVEYMRPIKHRDEGHAQLPEEALMGWNLLPKKTGAIQYEQLDAFKATWSQHAPSIYYDEITTAGKTQWAFWIQNCSRPKMIEGLRSLNNEKDGRSSFIKGVFCRLNTLFFVHQAAPTEQYHGFFDGELAEEVLALFKNKGFTCTKKTFPGIDIMCAVSSRVIERCLLETRKLVGWNVMQASSDQTEVSDRSESTQDEQSSSTNSQRETYINRTCYDEVSLVKKPTAAPVPSKPKIHLTLSKQSCSSIIAAVMHLLGCPVPLFWGSLRYTHQARHYMGESPLQVISPLRLNVTLTSLIFRF